MTLYLLLLIGNGSAFRRRDLRLSQAVHDCAQNICAFLITSRRDWRPYASPPPFCVDRCHRRKNPKRHDRLSVGCPFLCPLVVGRVVLDQMRLSRTVAQADPLSAVVVCHVMLSNVGEGFLTAAWIDTVSTKDHSERVIFLIRVFSSWYN